MTTKRVLEMIQFVIFLVYQLLRKVKTYYFIQKGDTCQVLFGVYNGTRK